MSERWFLCGALIAVCCFGLWTARRLNPVQPLTFALVWTLAVGSFYPLMTLFVRPLTWRNVYGLREETLLSVCTDYLAFSIGLVAVIWIASISGKLRTPPTDRGRSPAEAWRDGFVAYGMLGAGVVLYGTYVWVVGIDTLTSTDNLAEKYLFSNGLGALMIGLNLIICAALWGEASYRGTPRVIPFRVTGAAIIVWALAFLHVRTYAIILLLGYVYLFCDAHRIALRRVRPHVLLGLALCYVGLEGYAHLRGSLQSGVTDFVELAQSLDTSESTLGAIVGGSELSHPFITAMEVTQYKEPAALMGESHLEGLMSFVPLALMPNRPPTIAQVFAAEYYPEIASRGGGTAFSLVGEAWWNFGPILGPLLVGLLCGAFLCWIVLRCRRSPHGLVARLTPYGLFLVLSLHRNALTTSLKQLVMLLLPVLALVAAADLMYAVLARRRSNPPFSTRNITVAETG